MPLLREEDLATNAQLKLYNATVDSKKKLTLFHKPEERTMVAPTKAIETLLLRDDLIDLMAMNNTWGDFDFEAALDPSHDDFERHAKVLMNIIESALAAQKAKEDWQDYTAKLARHVKTANEDYTKPTIESDGMDYSRHLDEQAPTGTIYKTAILGAGASAAYYLAHASLDLKNTLLIGQADPWAGMRGGEEGSVINHPHNMIDPTQGDSPDFDSGLAERKEFAKRVAAVIAKVANQSDGRIVKVKKDTLEGATCHVIETSEGIYFAKEVVSALGIGPQRDQYEDMSEDEKWDGFEEEVMNMDKFMQADHLEELGSESSGYTIAVGGGNAAIDVVTAIIRNTSAKIYWFRGGRADPMFLDGTDNDVARDAYKDGDGTPDLLVVIKEYIGPVAKQDAKILVTGNKGATALVDEVTYGVGPDSTGIESIFDDSVTADAPTGKVKLDPDQYFLPSLLEKDPEKILDNVGLGSGTVRETLLEMLKDPPLDDTVKDTIGGVTLLETDPSPDGFDIIGGQQTRLAGRGSDEAKFQDMVTESLPGNVVVGDQLTPSRARVEATEHSMPVSSSGLQLVLESGGINLITANQTVIATHIANLYPSIPAGVADYLTVQLIVSRKKNSQDWSALPDRPLTGEPLSLEKQRLFQEKWIARLEKFELALHKLAVTPTSST